MVLKMDQRCAYAAKPFVPDLISQSWIGLSSKASDRLWFRREDKNRVESQSRLILAGLWGYGPLISRCRITCYCQNNKRAISCRLLHNDVLWMHGRKHLDGCWGDS
jgi:hypothetical protein